MKPISSEQVAQFADLFKGNLRSYGVFFPDNGRVKTVKEAVSINQYHNHLTGGLGLGLVPILDDGNCWFGVIDVDNHGGKPEIDLMELERKVRDLNLPLIVCRSKSGGAHLYLFTCEPIPAVVIRRALSNWTTRLGHAGCEIFPKQTDLPNNHEGQRQLGNWINLCWHDALNPDCLRYAIEGGKRISFEYFLELAQGRRVTIANLDTNPWSDFEGIPPCLQHILDSGSIPKGYRNQALYNFVVYLKRAFPDKFRERAYNLNNQIFDPPLSYEEVKRTVASAGRRDYRYKCKEEPIKSLCDSAVCVTRTYGIEPSEIGSNGLIAEWGALHKIDTKPPRFILHMEGENTVEISAAQLLYYEPFRLQVFQQIGTVLPKMKDSEWGEILKQLMSNAVVVPAPVDASFIGLIAVKLQEFFSRIDMDVDGKDTKLRQQLLTGYPVIIFNELLNQKCVYFRGSDFQEFLKKNRSDELKGPDLWMALRKNGVQHGRIWVNNKLVTVWFLPITDDDLPPKLEIPTLDPEY
jgi:hypothetical protein